MPKNQTFLLQLWQDQSGVWVVLKDQQRGLLHQFESLEALAQFLSRIEENPPEHNEAKEAPMVNLE